jgi:hypothetical protein
MVASTSLPQPKQTDVSEESVSFPASNAYLEHARSRQSPDQPQVQQDARMWTDEALFAPSSSSSQNHGTQFDEHVFPGATKSSPSPSLSFLPLLRRETLYSSKDGRRDSLSGEVLFADGLGS